MREGGLAILGLISRVARYVLAARLEVRPKSIRVSRYLFRALDGYG